MPSAPTESNIPDHQWFAWNAAPAQFKYPWGWVWHVGGGHLSEAFRVRPRGRAPYKKRRFTAFQRKMLDRITSNKPPEPPHPDQLYLF